MIKVIEKKECCGCAACEQKCPKKCITLHEDNEGFLFPQIDTTKCIECGLCEKVCPEKNKTSQQTPYYAYVMKHPSLEVQQNSSSGGFATFLSEKIIDLGGVVFGSKFNERWEVEHDYCVDKKKLSTFRGSKYVQSIIGNTFCKAEQFLKEGKIVLFTGTPCQIHGLNLFLGKEYDNLICMDFACHGVPSPLAFKIYIDKKFGRQNIKKINFRDKSISTKYFSLKIDYSVDGKETEYKKSLLKDPYLIGFIHNIYLRDSCTDCPSKGFISNADFTCGDIFDINKCYPEYEDKHGMSVFTVNTEKGKYLFEKMGLSSFSQIVDFNKVYQYNKAFYKSVERHAFHHLFFKLLGKVRFGALVFFIRVLNKLYKGLNLGKK